MAAAFCAWAALCLIFWQGSWQLLYHPQVTVARTPANIGLAFDDLGFAVTEAGVPRLNGWWIPAVPGARYTRYTALYLHGATATSVTRSTPWPVFTPQASTYSPSTTAATARASPSIPAKPIGAKTPSGRSSTSLVPVMSPAGSIVLVGNGLGANLALEIAASHPELAGVVLDEPLLAPTDAIFRDPRARLVPAHWLVREQWDSNAPATSLRIPSLWFYRPAKVPTTKASVLPESFKRVPARKVLVWLPATNKDDADYTSTLTAWLDDLHDEMHAAKNVR